MKFKYAFLTLLAGAALAITGCVEEAPVNDPALAVNVEPSLLNFDGKTAGSAEVTVTATASWSVSGVPSWITVTPPSGSTGKTTVTVAVEVGGEKSRSVEIVFKAGNDTKYLTVNQEGGIKYGTKDNPYTPSKAYDWVAEQTADAETGEVYIKGIISRIDEFFGTQYGNATFFISDDGSTDGKQFQIYRAYYFNNEKYSDPSAQNISIGDEVLIFGKCVNYKGNTPETAQNKAYLVELKAGTSPVLSGDVVNAEILADETEATFSVTAKNLKGKWTVTPKETYSWVSDYTKEGTESGNIVVKVAANTAEEARTAEFTVAAEGVSDVVLTLTQKGAKVVTTVAGIVEQITSTNSKEPSSYAANLAGAVVSYVNGNNAYIEDASGAILLYLANHGLTAGKKISGPVKGTGYLYNGLPEITAIGADAKIEDGGTIPETTMTIANLVANYQANLSRRIKLVGVTVKDAIADGDRNGVVTQGEAEINVYAALNNKGLVMTEGAKGDLICYPTLYKETKQVSFWDNADWTVGTTPTPQPGGVSIKTADEFLAWAADASKDAVLDADINLTGKSFTPSDLKANLDGNNHKITYTFQYAGTEKVSDNPLVANWGLFKEVSGSIKNLKVAGTIDFAPEAGSGTYHVGGIAGYVSGTSVIENCENEVDILATTKVTHHLGGIAGYTDAGATVKNCTNKGKVEMIIPDKGAANASQLGGIIGHIEGKTVVENCTNEAQLTYEGTGTPRVAGICGYINNLVDVTFKSCTNNGKIVINEGNYNSTSWSYVGGLTGYYGTPTTGGVVLYDGCTNNGDIELNITEEKTKMRVGGIASHGGKSSEPDGIMTWTLKNCTNNGDIVSTSTTANNYLGGVIGYTEVSCLVNCDGCTNTGKISVAGKGFVGGILGRNCSVKSTFTNFTVSDKSVLEAKDADGKVGLIMGFNSALTTSLTGKVAGTVILGSQSTVISADNYASFLLNNDLGEGGSVSGVSFGK